MSGFKLLAIRPLKGCNISYLKNLTTGMIFPFYNDYQFDYKKKNKTGVSLIYKSTYPKDFFNIDRYRSIEKLENNPIKVNVSAIVGQNGSGKSALSELFLYSLFYISEKLEFVDKSTFLSLESDKIIDVREHQNYNQNLKDIKSGLSVALYYQIDESYYELIIHADEIKISIATKKEEIFSFNSNSKTITKREDLPVFFYSMIVNYSFYGFNTNQLGTWIKAFFHKNDGYQMPVVINPYRDKGRMNINTESYLTYSRLLSNILSIEDYKDINPKSPIASIELYFDERKDYRFLELKVKDAELDMEGELRFSSDFTNTIREILLEPLYKLFFGKDEHYPKIETEIDIYAEIYLIQKLITIPTRYDVFEDFNGKIRKKESQDNFKLSKKRALNYAKELYRDRSHITLKVRQTLSFLNRNDFGIGTKGFKNTLPFNSLIDIVKTKLKESFFIEAIDVTPPPFLFSNIIFEDKSDFRGMSSGEKQKIYSLNSIVYHLKNIDSVHKNIHRNNDKNIITYESINLILDEIELYYHPEYQRNFLSDLLSFLKSANYQYINNINILFLTHSPFILSDIPNQNILKLKEGKMKNYDATFKTFGANIYSMLDDAFFMKNTLGQFAENRLKAILEQMTESTRSDTKNLIKQRDKAISKTMGNLHAKKYEQEEIRETIELIGEPIIKEQFEMLYEKVFIKDEISELKQRIRKLESDIKDS